jgi:tetratricopeptide (TPR) repeat protein
MGECAEKTGYGGVMLKAQISLVLKQLEAGETAEAARFCLELLRQFPDEAALHQLDAAIALREERGADALAAAQRAMALRPGHGPTLMLAGKAAHTTGDPVLARALLAEAAGLMPARAEPNFLHCAVLLEGGLPEAEPVLERLLQNFPDPIAGWQEITDILYRSGRPDVALRVLTGITDATPDAELLVKRAIILRQFGRMDEARAVLEQATRLDQNSARAWFLLGLTLQDEHLPGEAAAAFASARRADPDFAEAAVNEGIAWQEAGDLDAAKRAYGEAIRLRPDTFSRIAQAIAAAPKGELWLDLEALRLSLAG